MIYLTDKNEIHLQNTAVTLGKFDGVHLGHRRLVEALMEEKKNGRTTVVFTFQVPASRLLHHEGRQLVTSQEKRYLYEASGVDVLIDYPVDEAFYALTPEAFVKDILVEKLGVTRIISGPDFRFGAGRAGDVFYLREAGLRYGFEVWVLDKEQYEHEDISSTRVKLAMEQGDFRAVEEMQGHPYFFLAKPKGSEWVETFSPEKLLPKPGVYFCTMRSACEEQTEEEPVICTVLDAHRAKIVRNQKKDFTENEMCVILFRYV